MKVGTRELKNRLSYYLKQLRDDDPLYVTDRGEVIAEIRRVRTAKRKRPTDRQVLQALAAKGELTMGTGGPLKPFKPIKPKRPVRLSQIILEERR